MVSLRSPTEVAAELASRIRFRRLKRGWTQLEFARRAGIKPATYVLFERTGRISVLRLIKVLELVDLLEDFDRIGRHRDLAGTTLAELVSPERKRGRRTQKDA